MLEVFYKSDKTFLDTALNIHIIIWAEQTLWCHDCGVPVLFDSFEIFFIGTTYQ